MQHPPTTQGSAHLPEARAPLVPPSPALARPLAAATQNVRYRADRAHRMWFWKGSPSRRAPTWTACVASVTASAP
eukprot:4148641-Prymnesium_polylepis.1